MGFSQQGDRRNPGNPQAPCLRARPAVGCKTVLRLFYRALIGYKSLLKGGWISTGALKKENIENSCELPDVFRRGENSFQHSLSVKNKQHFNDRATCFALFTTAMCTDRFERDKSPHCSGFAHFLTLKGLGRQGYLTRRPFMLSSRGVSFINYPS